MERERWAVWWGAYKLVGLAFAVPVAGVVLLGATATKGLLLGLTLGVVPALLAGALTVYAWPLAAVLAWSLVPRAWLAGETWLTVLLAVAEVGVFLWLITSGRLLVGERRARAERGQNR